MELAIEEMNKSAHPRLKVGAVLVGNGSVIAQAHRTLEMHAERSAIEQAQKLNADLKGATIYTTLEPCVSLNSNRESCAELISRLGISTVVIGRYDANPTINRMGWRKLRDAGVRLRDFHEDLRARIDSMHTSFTDHFEIGYGPEGSAKFDYTLKDGNFEFMFSRDDARSIVTRWAMIGKAEIQTLAISPATVAVPRYAQEFSEIDDPTAHDFNGPISRLRRGAIIVDRRNPPPSPTVDPALLAWDDPSSILGRMSMKVAAILLLACFGGVVGHANAGLVATDEDPPGTPTIADDSQPADNDVAERLETMRERFGDYRSEAFKQSMADAAARQAALYPTQLAGAKPPQGVPQWRSTGPVSAKYQTNGVTLEVFDSGRVRRVLQDPAAPDTVYVLTAGGGVWKSTAFSHDNPRWKPLTDAVLDTSGGNMAMGRAQGTLYVGLGDPFDGIPTLSGGMIKTADGGDTWSAFVSLTNSATVQDVAVDTATGADIVIVATDVGLFRSANAGGSYSNVLPGYFWSLVRSNRGWLASSDDGKLYLSHDRGATWLQVLSFGVGASSVGRTTLGVGAPGDAIVYAFAATPGDDAQRDLFVSTTGGLSWIPLGLGGKTPTNPNVFQPDMNIMGGQAFYNQMLLVDSSDATRKTVYIGGQLATARTTDGGATWTLISDWLPGIFSNLPYVHADQHAATMIDLAGRPGIVFGTDGGIFVSSDGGASFDFTKNKGLDTQLAQTVMSSSMNPQTFGLGMQDTGTRVRMGSSGFFNQVTGGDGEGLGWSQANNAVTLTSAAFGVVFHSPGLLPDTFGSWTRVTPPLVADDNRLFYTKIATPSAVADPTGLIFLTASARRLYVVFDGAPRSSSWIVLARAGSKLPANFVIRETHHGIALDPNADFNRVAIVGTGGRVAFTLDGGLTWTTQTLIGLVPGFQGFNSAIAFTVSGAMYVVSESPIPGSVRVLKSIDNGATWVAAANGLPNVPIGDVREDPRDPSGQSLYVATGLGVYRTSDGGTTWSLFGAGLPTVRTSGLWVSADGRTVRVATYGRGAWEISP